MMKTTRFSLVSAPLFLFLFVGGLRAVSAQAPQQSPRAAASAAAAAPAQGATAPAPGVQEKPIRDLVDAFAKAYSAPDLKALAACFSDEADVVDSAGDSTRGKPAIIDMFEDVVMVRKPPQPDGAPPQPATTRTQPGTGRRATKL
jgi:hypothetical protein